MSIWLHCPDVENNIQWNWEFGADATCFFTMGQCGSVHVRGREVRLLMLGLDAAGKISFQDFISLSRPLSPCNFEPPGARFTNGFLSAIQIRWKRRLAVIPLRAIRSRQFFAHATTAQLSCHKQNFVAITLLDSRWECNEISIKFEMRWKSR